MLPYREEAGSVLLYRGKEQGVLPYRYIGVTDVREVNYQPHDGAHYILAERVKITEVCTLTIAHDLMHMQRPDAQAAA